MKYQLYAIKDSKAGYYADIFQLPNNAIAIRKFSEVCNEEKSDLHKYPEDFALYVVGSYDSETGKVTCCEPLLIDQATNYANNK